MKHEAHKGGTGLAAHLVSDAEAATLYALRKAKAPNATKEDVVEFLMTHDGNPTSAFKIAVHENREKYAQYIGLIASAIADDEYREMFFVLTQKNLAISPDHIEIWARDIAKKVLERTP